MLVHWVQVLKKIMKIRCEGVKSRRFEHNSEAFPTIWPFGCSDFPESSFLTQNQSHKKIRSISAATTGNSEFCRNIRE